MGKLLNWIFFSLTDVLPEYAPEAEVSHVLDWAGKLRTTLANFDLLSDILRGSLGQSVDTGN